MKTKREPYKQCDNCKYFSFRYYRANYTYSVSMQNGACAIKKFTEQEREKLPYEFVCDRWEPKPCTETDISAIKNELGEITAKLILIVKDLAK